MVFVSLSLAFLLLATGSSLAQDCDVTLTRDSNGSNTKIKTRAGASVINFEDSDSSNFKAFTKNGNDLTKVDKNGAKKVEDSTFFDERNHPFLELDDLQLNGTNFGTSGGRLFIDSTNGNKWTLGSSKSAKHLLGWPNSEIAALSFTNSTQKFTNIFVQNNSIVTLVDDQCNVETLPYDKLNNETQTIVDNLMNEARGGFNRDSSDSNGQRFDQRFGFPPMPPMPSPFGGFHYPPPPPPPFGFNHPPPPPPFDFHHPPPPPPFGGFRQPPPSPGQQQQQSAQRYW